MKTRHGRIWINICSAAVLAACAAAVSFCVLLGSRPLKEKGKPPRQESRAKSSSEETAWDGSFGTFLVCGIDDTNSLTDVILLVGFNNETGRISLLQIPRDTYAGAEIPSHKYNAVYNHKENGVSGMENLKAHIERDFGIPIDNYAAVTTRGLRDLVDAAGGVDLDVPINMNYDDPGQNLHIHLSKGMQHLSGAQAEQFVRYRKGWVEGDIGRLKAQRLFLAAFADKLRSASAADLAAKVLPVLAPPDFKSDLTTLEMLRLGLAAKKVSLQDAEVYNMPGEYLRVKGSSIYTVHRKELLEILNASFVRPGTRLQLRDLHIRELSGDDSDAYAGKSENLGGLLPNA